MHYLLFIIILIISATLIRILHRSRHSARSHMYAGNVVTNISSTKNDSPNNEPAFTGFVIEPGVDCCKAALELQRLTFSNSDRFLLPLSSCDKRVCPCQRKEVKERRRFHRRSKLDRRSKIRYDLDGDNRRKRKGRREQDKLWSGGYIY
jgi:hypothetical protein